MKRSFLFTLFCIGLVQLFAQTGVLSGKVVDAKNGETLIGATVVVDDNSSFGASTDIDGNFTIQKVPAGKHKVKVRYIGYREKEEQVDVKANDVTNLYLTLNEDAVNLNEVAVVATVTRRDNESAIVVMQKNSTIIQSGISAEEMKRSPDRSSSDVLRRVSGSTIQDGKFAIIRGLADRYNMAMLNNVILPSTEPDRKAFAFDVFPSNILDNIIIMKTGQPNLPSEWAGGLIQLNSRDIPEKNFFNVTIGQSFIEGTTFRPFKTYEGSKTDFLGFDNSVRPLPKDFPGLVPLNDLQLSLSGKDTLIGLGRRLNNSSWKVRERGMAYPGQSLQMSGGFAVRKSDIQFGGVMALSYANTLRYSNGTRTRYDADGTFYSDYNDERYNNSVTAALLGNFGMVIKNNHKINWKNLFTVNSDDNVFLRNGVSYFSATKQRRTSLEFTSARVFTSNLSGEHVIGAQKFRIRWNGGAVLINRVQPKTMRYSYERFYTSGDTTPFGPNAGTDPFLYQIQSGGSDPKLSAMFYSNLTERVYNGGADFTAPFTIKGNKQSITVGYYYQNRQRNFEARNLFFDARSASLINDPLFQSQDVDSIINQANFDNGYLTLNQVAFPQDIYTAKSITHAAYVMMENTITERFKAVWGFRFESFQQKLTSPSNIDFDIIDDPEGGLPIIKTKLEDTTYVQQYFSGAYKADSLGRASAVFPLLPSVNLIFKLTEDMNLRASYSQSMSRPEFREVSPFIYYDFVRDLNLTGNVNLLQTFIHNADLRWEWFMGKGQTLSASVFYKNFQNTIEQTAIGAGGVPQFVYSNAQSANLVGAELELRKNFGFASPKLEDLTFTANLAYIYSRVNLKNVKNNTSEERARGMQGQSPYIINLGLTYVHPKIKTGATLLYNMSGPRLYAVGEVGNPAWYEHFRPLLDLQLTQKLWKDKITLRLNISDLIARSTIFYQNQTPDKERFYQKDKDQVVLSERNFRTYSFNVSFSF